MDIDKLYKKNGISSKDIITIDWLFENSENYSILDRNYLNKINKKIRSCSSIYTPKYIVLYHATAFSLKETILRVGLLPTSIKRRRSYQSTNGYVYLAHDLNRAKQFGDLGNSSNIVIFAVVLRVCDLLVDKDQLKNIRIAHPEYDIKDTIADSLVFGGGVRVKGNIENYKIINLN